MSIVSEVYGFILLIRFLFDLNLVVQKSNSRLLNGFVWILVALQEPLMGGI